MGVTALTGKVILTHMALNSSIPVTLTTIFTGKPRNENVVQKRVVHIGLERHLNVSVWQALKIAVTKMAIP